MERRLVRRRPHSRQANHLSACLQDHPPAAHLPNAQHLLPPLHGPARRRRLKGRASPLHPQPPSSLQLLLRIPPAAGAGSAELDDAAAEGGGEWPEPQAFPSAEEDGGGEGNQTSSQQKWRSGTSPTPHPTSSGSFPFGKTHFVRISYIF